MKPTPNLNPSDRVAFALMFSLVMVFSLCLSTSAFDEFSYDLKLVTVLQKIEMYDYGLLQIERMLKQYPDRSEQLMLAKSRLLYATGKGRQADELVDAIPKDSKFYPEARLLTGEMAFRRNKFDVAEQAYKDFFAKVKPESVKGEYEVENYRRAVQIYARLLEKQGKGKEAAEVMEYLSRLQGNAGISERQTAFLRVQSILAAEEKKFGEQQKIDKKAVNEAIANLKELQWIMDGVAAASYVEMARAHVILDENEKAIEALKLGEEFMAQIEQTLAKQGNLGASPMAGALFYYAKALKGLARDALQAKDEDKVRQYLVAALKRFYKITQDYAASPYQSEAMLEFGKCENILEKQFGTNIGLSVDSAGTELRLKMEQAAAFFSNGDYSAATPIYLEGLRIGRRNRQAAEVGERLTICYAQLNRFLEARAVASYLAEFFPETQSTTDALLRLGAFIYQKAKQAKSADAEKLLVNAFDVWEDFLKIGSTHPKAPDIAFAIAEEQYRKAADLAAAVEKATSAAQKEELKKKAADAFLAAVPLYQRLVEQFITYPKGIRALYKLGWIYYSTSKPAEAADAFLRYALSENDPQRGDDRLEAKFRAAEQLMLGDAPAEAVIHFQELLSWLQPESEMNFDSSTKTAKRIKEDSLSYLAWATDLTAETYRPTINEFNTQIKAAEQEIKDVNDFVELAARQQKQAEKLIENAKAEFAEIEENAGTTEDKLAQLAESNAEIMAEDTNDMSAEERAMAERNKAVQAQKMAREMAARESERLQGEFLVYEKEREQIQNARNAAIEKQQKAVNNYDMLNAKLSATQQQRQNSQEEVERLTADFDRIEQGVQEAEEELQKLNTALDKAKEYQASDDPDLQKKGTFARQKIATMIQGVIRKLNQVHKERDQIVTPEAEQRRRDLEKEIQQLDKEIAKQEEELRKADNARALAAKEAELLEARLVAAAKALERNKDQRKLIELADKAAEKEHTELRQLTEEYLQAFRRVMEKQIEKGVLIQSIAKEEMALARQQIKKTEAHIADLKDEIKPVMATFEEWKHKAEECFATFLKQYPKSKHAPDNMARMGSIYLEFKDFAKAERTLSQLADRYPQSDAGKQALFNLGRSQTETAKYGQAAETFGKLLQSSAEIPTPNLVYISETMLQNQQPSISLAASRALLALTEDSSRSDYRELREKTREHALFRAGEACFALQNFDEAVNYYKTLVDENENTGYFFDAKFGMGEALLRLTPPQLASAGENFAEILQYAEDPVVTNKALCLLGETLALQGGRKNIAQAAARFQQIVLLSNPDIAETQEWIEKAYIESAKCFARLGRNQERDEMVAKYRELYPDGKYRHELNNLPAAEFAATENTTQQQP